MADIELRTLLEAVCLCYKGSLEQRSSNLPTQRGHSFGRAIRIGWRARRAQATVMLRARREKTDGGERELLPHSPFMALREEEQEVLDLRLTVKFAFWSRFPMVLVMRRSPAGLGARRTRRSSSPATTTTVSLGSWPSYSSPTSSTCARASSPRW